jgi:hypothetical protein
VVLGADFGAAPIAPILAGARARGMADALDVLGVAAVLIEASGLVLLANRRARAFFGAHLSLNGDRLATGDAQSERAIGRALTAVLAGQAIEATAIVPRGAGRSSLRLRVVDMAAEWDDPFQLLKAVVILDDKPAPPAHLAVSAGRPDSNLARLLSF